MTLDPTGVIAAVAALISGLGIAKIQARTAGGSQKQDRITQLEDRLTGMHEKLTADRTRHYEMIERLMGEEEELRDVHAAKLGTERRKNDDLRVQVTVLRAELLRRGVNPDRLVFSEAVPEGSRPQFEGRIPPDAVG